MVKMPLKHKYAIAYFGTQRVKLEVQSITEYGRHFYDFIHCYIKSIELKQQREEVKLQFKASID